MDISWTEVKRVRAYGIHALLLRETLRMLPPDSPLRRQPRNLGFSGQRYRNAVMQRHSRGLQSLQRSGDVTLVFKRIQNQLPDVPLLARPGTGDNWFSQVQLVIHDACDEFYDDRVTGVHRVLEKVVRLAMERYAVRGIAMHLMLDLAAATVTAYCQGFFIAYGAELAEQEAAKQEPAPLALVQIEKPPTAREGWQGKQSKTQSRTKTRPKKRPKARLKARTKSKARSKGRASQRVASRRR